ncbi:baculoviral IAP repeat-containing protein 7 [Camelus ferus]|nr:baculoviral IAP repeat-containing protein 7 [Camelus ferus]
MGLENRGKSQYCGPEPSHWVAGGSPNEGHREPHFRCGHTQRQDHTDGQILSQLRPLAEEEEEEGPGALSARPAFPGMGSEELRLASFYDWPLTSAVQPELLAAAGFFHTGQQDKVRCFFCYGGLQSWERGDDPWTEHARWFPRCEFLLRTKGRDFVCSVQESCCPPGSWDRSEEPEDTGPAAPSGQPRVKGSELASWGGSTDTMCASRTPVKPKPSPTTTELATVGTAIPKGGHGGVERGGLCRYAGDSQEWPAWSQCPAVQAVLGMGFGQGQVWQLLQRRYRRAVPTSAQWVLVAPESPGARDAEEQLQRLREERTCRVCLDRTVAVVFVPCGHLACAECAPSLQLCPICRAPIGSCVRPAPPPCAPSLQLCPICRAPIGSCVRTFLS